MEGNLRLNIDWASLIVGRKFAVFALFYFVIEGNCQVQTPRDLYLEGRFDGGYLRYEFGRLIFGGASVSEFCGLEWKIKIYMINTQKITL